MGDMRTLQRRIAIIGLGHRGLRTCLNRICKSPFFKLVAVWDPDKEVLQRVQDLHPSVLSFTSVDGLIDYEKRKKNTDEGIQCAYVSVPHSLYVNIVPPLLHEKIHVLKEKPAGSTSSELKMYQDLADRYRVRLVTASQGRHGSRWSQLVKWLPLTGDLHLIEGSRKITVTDLAEGWRGSKHIAGGGAVIDIGWHLIDTVLALVGPGYEVSVPYSRLFKTQDSRGYDCEDNAHIGLEFKQAGGQRTVVSSISISRTGTEKVDEITIVGNRGVIVSRKDEAMLSLRDGSSQRLNRVKYQNHEDFDFVLRYFHSEITRDVPSARYSSLSLQDAEVTKIIDTIYGGDTSTMLGYKREESKLSSIHMQHASLSQQLQWPRITFDVEKDVVTQLYQSVSLNDNEGIFHDFETEFKQIHGRPEWHALLHNSGTNALQALFYACQFVPGVEVSVSFSCILVWPVKRG